LGLGSVAETELTKGFPAIGCSHALFGEHRLSLIDSSTATTGADATRLTKVRTVIGRFAVFGFVGVYS
jgi:hypothetical protein